jgi:hypothetical protein
MQKQPVAAQGPKIDITKTTPILCDAEDCENDMFIKAMKFRKVSKLMTGQPQDGILPVEVYMCTACGNVNKEFDLSV